MKLRSLALNQFKKFTSPTRLDGIGDGLNVVVGPMRWVSQPCSTRCVLPFRKTQFEGQAYHRLAEQPQPSRAGG